MNPFKKLAGQTAIYGLPTIVGRLLNYFLVPLYTYSFAPEEYGVVIELMSYVSIILVILTFGMETAFFRFASISKDPPEVFSNAFYLVAMLASGFLILSIALFFSGFDFSDYENRMNLVYQTCFIIFFDAISAVPFTKLRQENKARTFAFIKSFNIALNISLNIFFIYFCKNAFDSSADSGVNGVLADLYNPSIGVGYVFISNLAASSLTFILLLWQVRLPSKPVNRGLLREMTLYAWPLIIAGLAGMINETFDRILLRYLLPDNLNKLHEIGIYGACYKISILMTIFVQTYRFAAEPFFFSLSKSEDSAKMYSDTMRIFFLFCLFIFLGTTLYLDLIQLFIHESYRSGLHVVPILLAANMCLGIYFNLSIWYKISGQTKFGAMFSIIGAAITLSMNFVLIPLIGYTGSAWATLACYSSMMILSYLTGQKFFPVNYKVGRLGLYSLLAIIIFFTSSLLEFDSLATSLFINTLLLLLFVGIIGANERKFFSQLIHRKPA